MRQTDPMPPCGSGPIGLFGGSFNPAHEGHLEMSLYALDKLGLEAIWWLVNPATPLKDSAHLAPLDKRLDWANKLTAPYPRIQVTDIENGLGTRYTVDTLAALRAVAPETAFIWLMGTDNLLRIDAWHNAADLFRTVPIAVFRRPGYDMPCETTEGVVHLFADDRLGTDEAPTLARRAPPAWIVLDNPLNALSATEIRKRTPL